MKRLIGRLLHIANSAPYHIGKEEFYAVKDRILKRWGTPDGYDVQHIPGKVCFGCDGGGEYYHWSGDSDICYRCGGSGWFKPPVWVCLKRYTLGGYRFHVPDGRSYKEPEPNVTNITGYIEHKSYGYRQVMRAGLILFLLFDWKSFARLFRERLECTKLAWLWMNRCHRCKCHKWSNRNWLCARCDAIVNCEKTSQEFPF